MKKGKGKLPQGMRRGPPKGSKVVGSLPIGSKDGELAELLRGVTPRVRLFFWTLAEGNRLDHVEAARVAGYSQPEILGARLRRRWPAQTARAEELWRQKQTLQPDELRRLNAELARGENSAFKDGAQVASVRLKALELAARMHGLLSDKLDVTLSRKDLVDAIKQKMASIEQVVSQEITVTPGDATDKDKTLVTVDPTKPVA